MARWLRLFSRTEVVAVLLLATMVLLALGTLFPQRPDDPAAASRWEEAARARYGALMPALERLGLFRWYTTPVPWAALLLLAVVTLLCTLNRWSALRSGLRRLSGPHWGTLMTHLAVPLILAALALSAQGWQEERTLAVGDTVALTHRSRLSLRADAIRVVRYPDGTPADYEVEVTFFLAGQEAGKRQVRMNAPATFGGVRLLILGYAQPEGHPQVTLLAVRDAGAPLWFTGMGLLSLGLVMTLLGREGR